MRAATWQPIAAVDPVKLGEARQQTRNAAQWLVRLAHTYMRPQPEHSHVLLRWDTQRQALVTQEFLPSLTMELRLPNLALQFREDDLPAPHVLEMDDRTPAEVEAWVLVELLHRRLDRDRFSKTLPYDFPNLMTGDAVPYVAEGLEAALVELSAWFSNGTSVLAAFCQKTLTPRRPVTVWCWPQVLHMGALLPATTGKTCLRIGMSPGDEVHAAPYYYVTPHDPGALTRVSRENCLTYEALEAERAPPQKVLEFLRTRIAAQQS